MKKSRTIDLNSMRKHARHFGIKRLSLAVAAFSLAACSSKEEVSFVTDAEDCASKTDMTIEECTAAYHQALAEAERTAPKYDQRNRCETDFGHNQCYQPSGSSFFLPFMAGYMVSSLMDRNSHGYSYNPGFHYQNRYDTNRDRIVSSDGRVLGKPGQSRFNVNKSAIKPKPATRTTIKRGGFGSTVAAKSSWGGGKSSGGWGG